MIAKYTIDKSKMLEPIKKSKWFYGFLFLSLLINMHFFGLLALLLVFGIFGIFIIFQIILQYQYYQHDKNTMLIIDYGNRIMRFNNNYCDFEIAFDDIQIIQRFKGAKYAKPLDSYVIPSNFYNWTRIKTNNGFSFCFSDFIKDDLNIHGIKRQEKIIPFLNLIKKRVPTSYISNAG